MITKQTPDSSTYLSSTYGKSKTGDASSSEASNKSYDNDDSLPPIKIRKKTLYLSVYVGLCEAIYADIQNTINNGHMSVGVGQADLAFSNDFRTVTNISLRHKKNNLFGMVHRNSMDSDTSHIESRYQSIATRIMYNCIEELNAQYAAGPVDMNTIMRVLQTKNQWEENWLKVQIGKGFMGIMVGLFLHGKPNRKKLIKAVICLCEHYKVIHIFAVMNMLTIALMTAYLMENKPVETWLDRCCVCFDTLKTRLDTWCQNRQAVQKNMDSRISNTDLVDTPTVESFIIIIKKFQETNFTKTKKYKRDFKEFDEVWHEYSKYHYTSPATPPNTDNHCLAIIAYDLLVYAQGYQSRYFFISSCGIPSCIGMVVGFWNGMLHPGCTPDTVDSIPSFVPRQEELLQFAKHARI